MTNRFVSQCGFAPGFVNYKKGALDSQPQVIKFTGCLHMVGGSLSSATTKTGRHDIAEILLKVALNTIKNISQCTLMFAPENIVLQPVYFILLWSLFLVCISTV